ncbi:MAG: response regulator, partial [Polyangiales bacterium]
SVTEAADGIEGVARTMEVRPDIAFVDIGLPGIDGSEVARRVRAQDGPSPYLVALSGYGSSEHREAAFAAGFDEHIAKPMAMDQLAGVMARARERSSAASS